jgi:perosamine synthetase
MYSNLIDFIRKLYNSSDQIQLHEPFFNDKEKSILLEVIDSSFVSSVGEMIGAFEDRIKEYTGSQYAVATVNGTSALHVAILLAGVENDDEVITQSLTFVATSNAIDYSRGVPVFLDVDKDSLSLSPDSLDSFLSKNCEVRNDGFCWNITSNRRIKSCIIMHTFGLSGRVEEIKLICEKYNIFLIEDAAESLGTKSLDGHTGTIADIGVLSFNGNKIITTGGGGMILMQDEVLEQRARHLTTTAKVKHPWLFEHDRVGYNYRMPNLNAALGLAQIDKLPRFIEEKRKIANSYQIWGQDNNLNFAQELNNTVSNYWLNALIAENIEARNEIIKETNNNGIMTRPLWTPMHLLQMNQKYEAYSSMENTTWLFDRIVNVPSSFSEELNF